jgi:CheY-like chemotaxis protein
VGRSVRTVQRMEVELGLPIRRPKGHARSSVMAVPEELDAWLKSFPSRRDSTFTTDSQESLSRSPREIRVLVVDDIEANRYIMSKNLRSIGYEVQTVESGRGALDVASVADVILLDVNLPEMHGFEVLRRLQYGLTTNHIPVICTSATYDSEGAAPVALQLGAKRFLTHPISINVLHTTIQDVLTNGDKLTTDTGNGGRLRRQTFAR